MAGRSQAGGLPQAFVSSRDASVLLGNGLEGDPNMGFWNTQSRPVPPCSQPAKGPPPQLPQLLASFCLSLASYLHWSVSSTSAFWTPFPLRFFRELCLGRHVFSSRGFCCWMRI